MIQRAKKFYYTEATFCINQVVTAMPHLVLCIKGGKKMNVNLVKREIDGIPYRTSSKPIPMQECLEKVEELYEAYKFSIPSEKEQRRKYNYFYALPENKLTDEQLITGQDRTQARETLEMYMLESICNGSLKWTPDMGGWFWKSPKDKELIILKMWIEPTRRDI